MQEKLDCTVSPSPFHTPLHSQGHKRSPRPWLRSTPKSSRQRQLCRRHGVERTNSSQPAAPERLCISSLPRFTPAVHVRLNGLLRLTPPIRWGHASAILIVSRLLPDVVVSELAVLGFLTLHEPGMQVARVVDDCERNPKKRGGVAARCSAPCRHTTRTACRKCTLLPHDLHSGQQTQSYPARPT